MEIVPVGCNYCQRCHNGTVLLYAPLDVLKRSKSVLSVHRGQTHLCYTEGYATVVREFRVADFGSNYCTTTLDGMTLQHIACTFGDLSGNYGGRVDM